MKVKIVCFGISRDLIGSFEKNIELPNGANISAFKNYLVGINPDFAKLTSLRIAVNEEYVDDSFLISENQELVIIPPVSGG